MNQLQNQVAIVTGASSGIGRAAASLFASEGAAVVVTARRQSSLAQLVDEIERAGGRAMAVSGDIADPDLARQLVDAAETHFGGLDIAFNNAATLGPVGPIEAIEPNDWARTLQVNLRSAFLLAQQQITPLRRRGGGSLIFTGTFVGHTAGFSGMSAYAASKSGLIGLVQALATEVGETGIRVNALLPGGTDTPMGRQLTDDPAALAAVARLHALRRLAQPAEIARAALFLASASASFVTGSALRVDGGVSVQRF
ncbi:MAG: SDR family oxidoreductase [Lysobacterales bacterium]